MTICQRSFNPICSTGVHYGALSTTDARRGLAGLWIPADQAAGGRLPNLIGQAANLLVTGQWQSTRAGIALYDQSSASFGKSFLPIAGNERPFSIWGRMIRTSASDAEIMRQYISAQADRMIFSIGLSEKIRYSHYGDLLSASSVGVGDLVSVGISEQPGEPVKMYLNGRLDATGGTTAGRCSNINTLLGTTTEYSLLALAIWLGRSLRQNDWMALHHNPNLLTPSPQPHPAPAELAPPIGVEEVYHRRIDFPNRPWWRRWSHRKLGY